MQLAQPTLQWVVQSLSDGAKLRKGQPGLSPSFVDSATELKAQYLQPMPGLRTIPPAYVYHPVLDCPIDASYWPIVAEEAIQTGELDLARVLGGHLLHTLRQR